MSFDDFSMVEKLRSAVESLVGLGTIQERLRRAFLSLMLLPSENIPEEANQYKRLVHEQLFAGAKADDLDDEYATRVGKLIVETSHRLTALLAATTVTRELQSSTNSGREPNQEAVEAVNVLREAMKSPEARELLAQFSDKLCDIATDAKATKEVPPTPPATEK